MKITKEEYIAYKGAVEFINSYMLRLHDCVPKEETVKAYNQTKERIKKIRRGPFYYSYEQRAFIGLSIS